MKTKSIFVLLLTLLICFGLDRNNGNLRGCICPSELTTAHGIPAIANTLNYICSDCGHTSNCCFSHKEIPFVGSLTLIPNELQQELPTVVSTNCTTVNACSTTLAKSGVNKAPPWSLQQTLVSLHQRLLI
jgi:hypothetical protein